MTTLAQLPRSFIDANFTNQTKTENDNNRIECVLAVSSKSGKIAVMRGNDDMKSSLFRHKRQVDLASPKLNRIEAYLDKAQQEFEAAFNEHTMINLDELRSPEFPVAEFEELKKLFVMLAALESTPLKQFIIEPSTLALAVAAANVHALNADLELYRTAVEDLRNKIYRKHANKVSASTMTRKDKNDALTAIIHGMAEEVKSRLSQALDDEHEVTGAIKKGLGIAVNTAKYNTKAERAKRQFNKEKKKEYNQREYQKSKQAEYDEYLGGYSWGELYEKTLKEMAEQKVRTVVYTK